MPILHHEDRPWGHFDWIFQAPGLIVKTLFVKPGARLSDQRHSGRAESWYVQAGTAKVYLEYAGGEKKIIILKEGEMLEIPVHTWHRLSAEDSTEPIKITEIWHGEILDENDIERRSDDYGRK